jgi:glutamyl-Q tRNA(Asp) synthetase
MTDYIGRFAPSPTGPLHMGSLVAAMASYLDAKAHHGNWLVRIEDVDEARSMPGAAEAILRALQAFGMRWDGDLSVQSSRTADYAAAYDRLDGQTYPCGCSRREIADSRLGLAPDGSAIYPGTCRHGLSEGKTPRALRIRLPEPDHPDEQIVFIDRWQGTVSQHLAREAGDFVLFRADGFWAYQLAVVVDDAAQGVTHVVRGVDLLDSTARQIYLQRLLGMPTPQYLHVPVVRNASGEKLSKQTGAAALDLTQPLATLKEAAVYLELRIEAAASATAFWDSATAQWAARFAGR